MSCAGSDNTGVLGLTAVTVSQPSFFLLMTCTFYAQSRPIVFCSVGTDQGPAAFMVSKMGLFRSFRSSDPSPSRTTLFGKSRCLCVPHSALPITRPRDRPFSEGVVDLRRDSKGKGGDSHRYFCSVYVQLSRFKSLQGLHLLEDIQPSDISFKPHQDLVTEMRRLQALECQTIVRWSVSEAE
jgi:hypothetical protein